jgi:hypothetical protein
MKILPICTTIVMIVFVAYDFGVRSLKLDMDFDAVDRSTTLVFVVWALSLIVFVSTHDQRGDGEP